MESIDVKQIRRRAWQSINQDGLLEIFAGLLFGLTTLYFVGGRAADYVAAFAPVIILLGLPGLRRRFTYPRVGYADLRSRDLTRIIIVAVLILDGVVFGVILNYDSMSNTAQQTLGTICANVSASVGVVVAIIFGFLGYRYGVSRYNALAVISLAVGFAIALLDSGSWKTGLILYLWMMGSVLMVWGALLFRCFLRRNPVLEGGVDDA